MGLSDVAWPWPQEIDDLSGGATPMRVVCTGYGIGATSPIFWSFMCTELHLLISNQWPACSSYLQTRGLQHLSKRICDLGFDLSQSFPAFQMASGALQLFQAQVACGSDSSPLPCTMRFGSTAKVLLKCNLKYYRISECLGPSVVPQNPFKPFVAVELLHKSRRHACHALCNSLQW